MVKVSELDQVLMSVVEVLHFGGERGESGCRQENGVVEGES
jgi:hypothetical protein